MFLDRPPSVGPKAQRVIDAITPGLVVGERVPADVRTRHRLDVAPYMGFRTEHAADSLGIGRLFVYVDEYIDDAGPSVSADARIESLTYFITDSARFAPIIARLDAALGSARIGCLDEEPGKRFRVRTWHADHGRDVRLGTFVVPSPPVEHEGLGIWGWLSFAGPSGPVPVPCQTP
jgi:hypothetical protein